MTLRMLPAALLCVATLVGCGATADPTPSMSAATPVTPPKRPPTGDPSATATALVPAEPLAANLTLERREGEFSQAWTLTCQPTGGTLPWAKDACAELDRVGPSAFAPPPTGQVCTEQYGGRQTVEVTGAVAGAPVSALFSLTNGCEISRWTSMIPIIGPIEG